MIYTDMTKKAMNIAYDLHKGQMDKGGVPYIFHSYHLAEQMKTEYGVIAALLHDTLEDTPATLPWLREQGFPEPVLKAVSLLTHDKSIPYMDYIRKLCRNSIAYYVKLADLKHNSNLSRLGTAVTDQDRARLKKYQEAILYMESQMPKSNTPQQATGRGI